MQVIQLEFEHWKTTPAAKEYPTCAVMQMARLDTPVMQIRHPGSHTT